MEASEGPGSAVGGRDRHPLTHVAFEDTEAYAAWAGKELPTQAEWEFAARGLEQATFTWGDEFAPKGRMMANTWQGEVPWQNLMSDGLEGTSPVRSFLPNGYGLYDMAGNVWEWTADFFGSHHAAEVDHACCAPERPRATTAEERMVPGQPGADIPRRVIKGGSHLGAPNYCLCYRPAARRSETVDTSTAYIGFRCVVGRVRSSRVTTSAGLAEQRYANRQDEDRHSAVVLLASSCTPSRVRHRQRLVGCSALRD